MSRVIVDRDRCTHDAICSVVCPKDLLRMVEGVPLLPEDKDARCNLCGQCVAFCPAGAVSLQPFEGEAVEVLDPTLEITVEQSLQFLKSRRSVRTFSDTPVSRDVMHRMLDAARLAPSGGNNQIVEWIVVERTEVVRDLARLVAEWFDTTARADPVLSKRYAIDSILDRFRSGTDVILRNAPHLVAACTPTKAVWGPVDSAIALTFFSLAAHAHGVGCCWAGYLIRAAATSAPLRACLGVGTDRTVQGAMVFGNARFQAHRIPCRNRQSIRWL